MSAYRAATTANLPALPYDRWGGGDLRSKDLKSWMLEHARDCHGGQVGAEGGVGDYKFKVSGVFRMCVNRQIDEGLRMSACECSGGVLLNSKNEFLPRKISGISEEHQEQQLKLSSVCLFILYCHTWSH